MYFIGNICGNQLLNISRFNYINEIRGESKQIGSIFFCSFAADTVILGAQKFVIQNVCFEYI